MFYDDKGGVLDVKVCNGIERILGLNCGYIFDLECIMGYGFCIRRVISVLVNSVCL